MHRFVLSGSQVALWIYVNTTVKIFQYNYNIFTYCTYRSQVITSCTFSIYSDSKRHTWNDFCLITLLVNKIIHTWVSKHIYFSQLQLCTTLLLMMVRVQHTDTILSRNVFSSPSHGNTMLMGTFADKIVYLFQTVPITLSTWIRRWAIVLVFSTSLASNWQCPLVKAGIFTSAHTGPWSASSSRPAGADADAPPVVSTVDQIQILLAQCVMQIQCPCKRDKTYLNKADEQNQNHSPKSQNNHCFETLNISLDRHRFKRCTQSRWRKDIRALEPSLFLILSKVCKAYLV